MVKIENNLEENTEEVLGYFELIENLNLSKLNYWYSLIVESLEFNDIMKKYKVWESSDSPLITNFIT